MIAPGDRWHRDVWAEAVWSSQLRPLERLVALAYADHARDKDTAWLSSARLRERTGLSRTAASDAVRRLVKDKWLVPVDRPRQGHTAHYRLVVPSAQMTASRTSQMTASRTTAATDDRLAAPDDRLATPDDRLAALTSGLTSVPTSSLSPGEESSDVHTPTSTRETTEDASWGARTLAALGACDLTVSELDAAQRLVERRVGVGDSYDAVLALVQRPTPPRDLLAYVHRLTDDELHVQAEKERKSRQQQTRRSSTRTSAPSPYRCEHGHPNGLRRSADGGSLCAACSGAAPVRVRAATAVSA